MTMTIGEYTGMCPGAEPELTDEVLPDEQSSSSIVRIYLSQCLTVDQQRAICKLAKEALQSVEAISIRYRTGVRPNGSVAWVNIRCANTIIADCIETVMNELDWPEWVPIIDASVLDHALEYYERMRLPALPVCAMAHCLQPQERLSVRSLLFPYRPRYEQMILDLALVHIQELGINSLIEARVLPTGVARERRTRLQLVCYGKRNAGRVVDQLLERNWPAKVGNPAAEQKRELPYEIHADVARELKACFMAERAVLQ